MAALSLIFGSILGWFAAALALMAGTLASTAFIVFLMTSLICAGMTLFAASRRTAHASQY